MKRERSRSSQLSEETRLVIRDGRQACGLCQTFENLLNLVWSILWRRDQQLASIVNLALVGKARSEEALH